MKFFKWLFLIFFCFTIVGGVISYLWLRHYIYSPHFSEDVVKIGNDQLKGEFTLEELDPENWGFKAGAIGLKNSGKIAELEIKNFQTYFKKWALLKRTWHMKSMECEELTIHISRKKKNAQPDDAPKEENVEPEVWNPHQEELVVKKDKVKHKPLIHALIPTDIEFDKLLIESCDGSVERKKRDVSWEGVSLNGVIQDKTLTATLRDGFVNIPLKILPKWNVNEVKLSLKEDSFTVHSSDFTQELGGVARVSGEGDFSGDSLMIDAEFFSVPVKSLVKEPDFTILKGEVNGNVKAVNHGDDTLVKGQLFLSNGSITLPKILKPVVKLLGDNYTETIALQQCVGDVKHIGDTTVIENLYIESQGLLSVTGRVELIKDSYRGMCRLGVSQGMYERLPKSLTQNMQENNGFFWVPVRLEGEKEEFVKDITMKVAQSLGGSLLKENDLMKSLEESVSRIIGGDELSAPIQEKAEKLLNKGLNALEKLFK